jgi:AcrR family transcriptional regulator
MTARQLERRQRLVATAVELVSERGIENVQIKQVSERAGVALGTAYRYFVSKDHLLAEAMVVWMRRLADPMVAEAGRGTQPRSLGDRVTRYVHLGLRAFQRHPHMARLLIATMASSDPFAWEANAEMARATEEVMAALLTELPRDVRDLITRVVGYTWRGELEAWVNDRRTVADLYVRVEEVIRFVLAPYETDQADATG